MVMDNILEKIVATKRKEIAKQKEAVSTENLVQQIGEIHPNHSFKDALIKSSAGIIAEFKRKSPSRSWIFKEAKIEDVIPLYSQNGASAISILTDMDFFGGTFDDFRQARGLTDVPLLRKDFIVDEYQIFQSKQMQADVILLIASALSVENTRLFAKRAKELKMDVLLEIHNEKELDYINEFVDVVGVNNRNLSTFVTDVNISLGLADKIPQGFVKISESGISSPETVKELRSVGFQGFLMGENFMKTENPGKALETFIKELAHA